MILSEKNAGTMLQLGEGIELDSVDTATCSMQDSDKIDLETNSLSYKLLSEFETQQQPQVVGFGMVHD